MAQGPVKLAKRYVLSQPLGEGAQARVWSARDALLDQEVAIKLAHQPGPGPFGRRELAALRALDLPGVVRLLDEGEHEGRPFLVMERAPGRPWRVEDGPQPWEALAPIAAGLLRLLRVIHDRHIIHRDIKPAHVLVDGPSRFTLIDFGVASGLGVSPRALPGGGFVGDPDYAAPEQRSVPEQADARADLYALGRTLKALLAGRLHPEARPEGAPEGVWATLEAMTQRRRGRRPASATEALDGLGLPQHEAPDAAFAGWSGRTLRREELLGVLAGPERIAGLASAAADVALARAGSRGEDLARELSAWLREGLARWEGGGLFIGRAELRRLQRRGQAPADAAALDAAGHVGEAIDALDDALALARREDPERELSLLHQRVHLALRAGRPRDRALGLYEVDRAGISEADAAPLRALLMADGERGVPLPPAGVLPPLLDRWRLAARVRQALHEPEVLAGVLAEAESLAGDRPEALADLAGWRGLAAYGRGDMPAAARLHGQAAGKAHLSGRLSALGNQASALLELGALDEALEVARALIAEAIATGQEVYAARGEWVARAALYRMDRAEDVDWPLVHAARRVDPYLRGQLLLTECAVAWRRGERHTAARLAARVVEAWAAVRDPTPRWLADVLALALSPDPDPARCRALRDRAAAVEPPGVALQGLGLLAWARPSTRDGALAARLAARVPEALRHGRREFMTLDEALTGEGLPPPSDAGASP